MFNSFGSEECRFQLSVLTNCAYGLSRITSYACPASTRRIFYSAEYGQLYHVDYNFQPPELNLKHAQYPSKSIFETSRLLISA